MKIAKRNPFESPLDLFGAGPDRAAARWPSLFNLDVDEMQGWTPRTDITETKKKYIVKADLPEVEKEDMHVSVKDGALLIEGERRQHNEEEDEKFHRIESMYGKFSRMFTLPPNVDEAHIKAKAKDGVLRVHIPKLSESEPAEEKEVKID